MSENNNPTPKIKVVPFAASIKIEVGGGFYGRINQLIMAWSAQKTPEEFTTIMKYLSTPGNEPRDEFEYHLVTLVSLMTELEEKAEEQKQTVEADPSQIQMS